MVAIIILGIFGFALILWLRSQQAAAAAATAGLHPGVNYAPGAPPTAEQLAITSIPVVGPVANYAVVHAQNAIVQNRFLEEHSQVGPNKGQTLASAGVAGVTVHISDHPIYYYFNPENW